MKKTVTIILCFFAAVAVLVVGGFLIVGNVGKDVQSLRFERQVTLTDGAADPAKTEVFFTIDKGMEYIVEIEWEISQPGILNGIRISNEQGETMYACTGDWATIEMMPKYLAVGDYLLEAYYLTNEKDFIEFCIMADIALDSIGEDIDMSNAEFETFEAVEEAQYEYATEGQWDIKYELKIRQSEDIVVKVIIIMGIAVGLLLSVIIFAITKTTDRIKSNYDERQEIVRGKGFKYGFFTLLICNGWFALTEELQVFQFAEPVVAMALSIFVGIVVYAGYSIWNDGYFALNENKKTDFIIFAIICILNMGIGIGNICQGYGFEDGRLTFRSINLFCGIMALILLVVLVCKQIKERRED